MPDVAVIPPSTDVTVIFDVLNGSTPFFGIALTFAVYHGATRRHQSVGSPVCLHPLLIAVAAIAVLLEAASVPYDRYYRTAEPLHWLLGPVVVLLAVPLWRQLATIRETGVGLLRSFGKPWGCAGDNGAGRNPDRAPWRNNRMAIPDSNWLS